MPAELKRVYNKKRDYTMEWFHNMQLENRRKLDEIFNTPNYQEVYGRKHYGENWMATLWGNHPDRDEHRKETSKAANRRLKGEDIPKRVTHLRKPIIQMDLDGNELEHFPSSAQWAVDSGRTAAAGQTIVNACRGKSNTAFGYKWKFKD